MAKEMDSKTEIESRFKDLISEGKGLVESLPLSRTIPEYWVPEQIISVYQRWLYSAANLIRNIDTPSGTFFGECDRILDNPNIRKGIPSQVIQKMYGLLQSAQDEWVRGLLRKIEHIIFAEAFDDFLVHASDYHRGGKKVESAVLASAVLEDTVKRIARKNNFDPAGKGLEELIDALTKANVFTPVKAKRIKGFSGPRNPALHAEWDKFDIKDVGVMIEGVRELIENYL